MSGKCDPKTEEIIDFSTGRLKVKILIMVYPYIDTNFTQYRINLQ